MPSNADYTQEYFDIVAELNGDIAGRRATREYMLNSTAIVHHKVVSSSFIPRLYNRKTLEAMTYISSTAHTILCKVMQRYFSDEAYRDLFSFDDRLKELIMLPRGYDSLLPFARVDIFLNEDDYSAKFCEFNADGSSGMNEDREIVHSIENTASFTEFSKRHTLTSSELFTSWVEEFIAIYKTYEHKVEHPRIAICDYLENAVVDEFAIFCEIFAQYGYPCIVEDVRNLSFDGEVLRASDGEAIHAIWRRSVTNDILEHWEQSQDLIEAVKAEKLALIGSFAGHLVHDKQIFRVLHLPQTAAFLTDEEVRFIKDTIPFTAFLTSESVDLDAVKRDKDSWIIKPTDHYGSDEVHAGSYYTQTQWEQLIDKFANRRSGIEFIAQEYCTPFKTMTLVPDEEIETLSDEEVEKHGALYNNLSGLYLYNGQFKGVFSRLGPLPTISKDMKGITSATIWVDC